MIFDKYANLKYKFGNKHFWQKDIYISTVELNEATIKVHLRAQENRDIVMGKLSVTECEGFFKGRMVGSMKARSRAATDQKQ